MHRPKTWGMMVLALVLASPLLRAAPPGPDGGGGELPPPAGADPAPAVSLPCAGAVPPSVSTTGAVAEFPAATPGGCGACGNSHGGVVGGVGLYLLQPYFSNNPAISFFRQNTGPGRREDIRSDLSVAPLLWLGYVDDSGLGIRGRWWELRDGTGQSSDLPPPAGGTLTVLSAAPLGAFIIQNNPRSFAVTSKLQLQVADLEVMQTAALGRWNFLFSGGLGYADITQNYNAYAVQAGGRPATPLHSGSSFVGLGPVLALEARHPLGDTWLSLYGSGRTRLLFGDARQTAEGGDELKGTQEARQHGTVAVGEAELGIEYNHAVSRCRLFGQLALVGQEWFGAGNATRSSRGSPPTTITNFSTEDNSNFGLLGLAFRVGLDF
jgi:hypothetical protein